MNVTFVDDAQPRVLVEVEGGMKCLMYGEPTVTLTVRSATRHIPVDLVLCQARIIDVDHAPSVVLNTTIMWSGALLNDHHDEVGLDIA